MYDLEMLEEMGFCHGVENYSRWLDGRAAGETPYTLHDYFPEDLLVVLDESHVSVPQIGGMSRGDRARKETLVEYGWRLPSALDNRPLRFDEWEKRARPSASTSRRHRPTTSSRSARAWWWSRSSAPPACGSQGGGAARVRPGGRPARGDPRARRDRRAVARHDADQAHGGRAHRLLRRARSAGALPPQRHQDHRAHGDHPRAARGVFDVLVGINLLREGLDIPEVSLVAILDADKEGFLRSTRSLIQTIGRAARNVNGSVLLYADRETGFDPRDPGRDEPSPRGAGALQPGARHHAAHDSQEHLEHARLDLGAGLRDGAGAGGGADPAPRAARAHREPAPGDARGGRGDLAFERAAELRDRIQALEAERLRIA